MAREVREAPCSGFFGNLVDEKEQSLPSASKTLVSWPRVSQEPNGKASRNIGGARENLHRDALGSADLLALSRLGH